MVFVSAIANAVAMGLGTLNFGLFIPAMEADLGINRAQFGTAASIRQIAGALTSPVIGRLIDRHGVRWLLPASTLIGCACLAGVAYIDSGLQLIVLFAVIGLAGMLGPGQLLTTVPVTKWFVALRPKAIAYMSLGVPAGALIFMPLTQVLIDSVGWRATWITLACIAVLVICPLSILWIRRVPEDLGQHPDGKASAVDPHAAHDEPTWTLREAQRAPVFWLLAFATGMIAFAVSTLTLHRLPEFVQKGIDPLYVGLAIAWDAVLAGFGTYAFGMLGARVPVRIIGTVGFVLLSMGTVLTIYVADLPTLLLAMSVWGFGVGGMLYVSNLVWAEYFGRENVGMIRGFVTPITLLLGASGAPVAGIIYDNIGTYAPVWWGAAGLMLLSAALMFFSHPPKQPEAS